MATRSDARTETREEFEARLLRQSDEADAGAYDHLAARALDYLISQLPDGYTYEDGHIVRGDPNLPADIWIASISNGVPTGQMVKITAL